MERIIGPDNLYGIGALGYVYAKAGRREDAVKLLDRLMAPSREGLARSGQVAFVYFGLGEKDKMFQWLARACDERDHVIGSLKADPLWDSVRSDPRFTALLKRIGLG